LLDADRDASLLRPRLARARCEGLDERARGDTDRPSSERWASRRVRASVCGWG